MQSCNDTSTLETSLPYYGKFGLQKLCGNYVLMFVLVIWLKGGRGGVAWPDFAERAARAAASGTSQSKRSEPKLADANSRVPETRD